MLVIYSDMFCCWVDVIVNPVNCQGVMGKGLALQFKKRYPECYPGYKQYCDQKMLRPGLLHWVQLPTGCPQRYVLNFPTKDHWRNPSRLEWIEAGLQRFCHSYTRYGIRNAAFPALGCGEGGLSFDEQVLPLMKRYLDPLPIYVWIVLLKR